MTETEIMSEIREIKKELTYIREHMIDTDMVLTPDEETIVKEGVEEFEKGKTVKLSDLKKGKK